MDCLHDEWNTSFCLLVVCRDGDLQYCASIICFHKEVSFIYRGYQFLPGDSSLGVWQLKSFMYRLRFLCQFYVKFTYISFFFIDLWILKEKGRTVMLSMIHYGVTPKVWNCISSWIHKSENYVIIFLVNLETYLTYNVGIKLSWSCFYSHFSRCSYLFSKTSCHIH